MSNKSKKDKTVKNVKENAPFIKVAAFLGPAALLIGLFYFLPGIMTILLSITDMGFDFSINFVGLENFMNMTTDPTLGRILRNTFIYVFGTLIFFNVGMGLVLALLTSYAGKKGAMFFRLVWLLPRMTPPLVYILMWQFMLDPSRHGAFNLLRMNFLELGPINFFSQHPMAVIIIVNGFIGASMGMIVLASAIESIPISYFRAARIDGASELQIIKNITLPMIKWPLMFITVYQTLALFTSFEYILALTGGGPFHSTEVLSLYAYNTALNFYDFGYGSALAAILVIIGIIFCTIYWKLFRFENSISDPKIEIT